MRAFMSERGLNDLVDAMQTTTSEDAAEQAMRAQADEQAANDVVPRVSVVFGTHNRIELLKRSVASIRQSAGEVPYEIVVCDGGSTDGSRRWLAEQDDVVLVGRRELQGAVVAFNNCAMMARGEYIATLNDDVEYEGSALADAVRILDENESVGQVAIAYRVDGERDYKINFIKPPDHHYANFGVIRRSIVQQATAITGGMWSPAYYTYGADSELSCWVHRFGYEVRPCDDIHIIDREANDALRSENHIEGRAHRDGRMFWQRWPELPAMLKPHGPVPNLTEREQEAVRCYEANQPLPALPVPRVRRVTSCLSAAAVTRLQEMAPLTGHAPWRVKTIQRDERVLHVHLDNPQEPQNSLRNAFAGLGDCRRIDWPAIVQRDGPRGLRDAILAAAQSLRPTLVFMQLQRKDVIDLKTIVDLRSLCDTRGVIVHWTGDIIDQYGPEHWYGEIGRACDLMLFSCNDHALTHRQDGLKNAAYLQIGYCDDRYFPGPDKGYGRTWDVVLLAQRYDPGDLALHLGLGTNEGALRREIGELIMRRFRKRGGAFGGGWPQGHMPPGRSGDVYRASHMAVSISLANDLERYSSDRLLRIMASGTAAAVKRFPDMASWGLVHEENCLVFETIADLEKLFDKWINRNHVDGLREIGRAGAQLMQAHHSWETRMAELLAYVSAVRGEPVELTRPW